jgi:hypothetical protein
MNAHEQTGPLWTEAVRAECARQSAECGDIPCWRIPPGDGPVDEPYGQIDPCAQCLLAVLANEVERLTAERDALAQRVAALEAERAEMIREIRAAFGEVIDWEWAAFAAEHPERMTKTAAAHAHALIGMQDRWPELFDLAASTNQETAE